MREIKFRAWDCKTKKMFAVHELSFREINGAAGEAAKIAGYGSGGSMMEGRDYYGGCNTKRLTLMQFTGLRDKNGVEVYEGDCYKIPLCWPVFIVEWNEQHAQWRLKGKNECGQGRPLAEWIEKAEYVGNVYENEDLLK